MATQHNQGVKHGEAEQPVTTKRERLLALLNKIEDLEIRLSKREIDQIELHNHTT